MLAEDVIGERIISLDFEFECPGHLWNTAVLEGPVGPRGGTQITVSRCDAADSVRSVAVWSLTLPRHLAGVRREECSHDFFAVEREAQRPPGYVWTDFVEGVRLIAGEFYPTLSFRVTADTPDGDFSGETNGLFLLYFPKDYEARPRFYVLMFQENRVDRTTRGELDALVDTVVTSFEPTHVSSACCFPLTLVI